MTLIGTVFISSFFKFVIFVVRSQALSKSVTLSQPGRAANTHHISTGTAGISDLPAALDHMF